MGIHEVGEATALGVAQFFGGLEQLQQASVEQLEEVPDVGPVVAKNIHEFFSSDTQQQMLHELQQAGVTWPDIEVLDQADASLAGNTYVITGKFGDLNRSQIKSSLQQLGAKVAGSVSSKTTALIAGERAGSKLNKASELGIPVLNEEQLNELLN